MAEAGTREQASCRMKLLARSLLVQGAQDRAMMYGVGSLACAEVHADTSDRYTVHSIVVYYFVSATFCLLLVLVLVLLRYRGYSLPDPIHTSCVRPTSLPRRVRRRGLAHSNPMRDYI